MNYLRNYKTNNGQQTGEYFVYLPEQRKNFGTMEKRTGKPARKNFGKHGGISVFKLKIHVFKLKTHIFNLNIHVFNLKTENTGESSRLSATPSRFFRLRTGMILSFLSACLLTAPLPAQPKYEIRATWLTTLGGMDWPRTKAVSRAGTAAQKKELTDQLDALQRANLNTVLFQTRLRGDVIYPSQIEPFAECLTGHTGQSPDYDPLKFAIEECHKRGMEFHAWIVCIPIGNRRQVGLHKQSVVKSHPGLCRLFNGTWYLDPGNPGTADYLARIVREIVSNYDVDGIHLDYIRYPEHGEKFPDQTTYRRYGRKQELKQWRRDNITRIVRRIYAEVKALKPWVKVSSSPVGKYDDTSRYSSYGWNAYHAVCQDAQLWMEEGIHDALFPMMYFQKNQFYPFALDWQENKHQRWVVPGLGIYFLHPKQQDWDIDEIMRQIYFTRKTGLNGQAYFRNKFLLDNTKGLLNELSLHFYTYPAVIPPMSWADSIAPTVPEGTRIAFDGKNVRMKWQSSSDNTKANVYYRIYASNTYPVDTEDPKNLISTRTDSCSFTYTPPFPWMQRIYWAVTSVDRFGNESAPSPFNRKSGKAPDIFEGKLPDIPEGYTLIVSDATGAEILRTKGPRKDIPAKLGTGFFRFSLLAPDGTVTLIGVTAR